MRTLWTIGLLLGGWISSVAAPPFAPGEILEYRLHWGVFTVGRADLRLVKAEDPALGPAWQVSHSARTQGFADTLYRVRNEVHSWMTPDASRALLYRKTEREGGRERDVEVTFDWAAGTARYTNRAEVREPVTIAPGTQDPLSVVYAARLRRLAPEESIRLPVTNGKVFFEADIRAVRRETVQVGAGRFETVLVVPEIRELGGVFRKSPKARIEIWFSDDERWIPVKLASRVSVGHFRAELQRYQPGIAE